MASATSTIDKLIIDELQEYLNTSTGQSSSNTGFELNEAPIINVLVVGRSQRGKTTLVESLKSHLYTSHVKGFSDTRDVTCYPTVARDKVSNKCYHMNFIDTIGLSEVREDHTQTRSDTEILDLAARFIQTNIISFNAVILVSRAGETHLNDLLVFKSITGFLGSEFSAVTMMVLTHCDGFDKDKFNEFVDSIKTNPLSKELSEYCKLGIYPHGTLNFDLLKTFDKDLRPLIIDRKMQIIAPMRKTILQILIAQAYKPIPVKQLQEIMKLVMADRQSIIEEAVNRTRIEEEKKRNEAVSAAIQAASSNSSDSNSCFVAGTLIRMADETEKPIEAVVPGDMVLGADGKFHAAMFLDVEQLGDRYLYGINGCAPFATNEHIFLTSEGIKVSVDPKASETEEPSLQGEVKPLREGVELQTLKNGCQSNLIVEHVNSTTADSELVVFNVVLESGHSYYANGFAVSDMFPDLSRYPRMFKFLHLLWRSRAPDIEAAFDDIVTPGSADRLRFEKLAEQSRKNIDIFLDTKK